MTDVLARLATARPTGKAPRPASTVEPDAQTLATIARAKEGPIRLLVAARIGRTRLIDNVAV